MLQDNPLNKETKMKHACCVKCVSWSAIIVGSFVAIGLGFLLNLFGISIGLSLLTSTGGTTGLAVGGFIALLIGTIIIMFVAGWVSGYLGREHAFNPNVGALYGFTTWCLALIISIFIAANMSEYLTTHNFALNNVPTASSMEEQAKGMFVGGATQKHKGGQAATRESSEAQAATPEATKLLEETLFLTFLLFFFGALSSCVGGYAGLNLRCRSESKG